MHLHLPFAHFLPSIYILSVIYLVSLINTIIPCCSNSEKGIRYWFFKKKKDSCEKAVLSFKFKNGLPLFS